MHLGTVAAGAADLARVLRLLAGLLSALFVCLASGCLSAFAIGTPGFFCLFWARQQAAALRPVHFHVRIRSRGAGILFT